MFDPFGDFETAGYLRNKYQEKDARIIKRIEHEIFTRQMPKAIQYLATQKSLNYSNFLAVHEMLFSEFYPWAGQDRAVTMPDRAVVKGKVIFCHPHDAKRAVDEGLRLGQTQDAMNDRPGEIMGLFAYGHPFLYGNGRTMLLVHMELCHRAGFSIAWERSNKTDYLDALTKEIDKPGKGILDSYLLRYKGAQIDHANWGKGVFAMNGLDGLDEGNQVEGDFDDPAVAEQYRKFEEQRGYSYAMEMPMCPKSSGPSV